MSKQYESAYETICAQKHMKQCVVALNNNLQQAKKNLRKRKLRQCSKLVFKHFRIWLDHATDRILEILRSAHHAFVDVCHCSFLRTLRSCFARFFLFLGRFVCVSVPQIVSHEYHGEACFISALLWKDELINWERAENMQERATFWGSPKTSKNEDAHVYPYCTSNPWSSGCFSRRLSLMFVCVCFHVLLRA